MTFPTDFTTVTEDILDVLGEVVSHTPEGGGASTDVNALFDRVPTFASDFSDSESLVFETTITVKTSDASAWAVGDSLTARSVTYNIVTLEPDAYGATEIKVTAA